MRYGQNAGYLGSGGDSDHMPNYSDRDWFYPFRGEVFAFPRGPHPLQPKIYFAAKVVAWVWGPHTGKRLPNRPYGTLHSACSDLSPTRGNGTGAVADSEDLE